MILRMQCVIFNFQNYGLGFWIPGHFKIPLCWNKANASFYWPLLVLFADILIKVHLEYLIFRYCTDTR